MIRDQIVAAAYEIAVEDRPVTPEEARAIARELILISDSISVILDDHEDALDRRGQIISGLEYDLVELQNELTALKAKHSE